MCVCLIVVGECMFGWVVEGFVEYCKWFLYELLLELIEFKFGVCGKGCDDVCVIFDEGVVIFVVILCDIYVIVFDGCGKIWFSEEFVV